MRPEYDMAAATKTLASAVAGFLVTMAAGYGLGRLAESGSYEDLAIYALTLVFFAPIGAMAAAYAGMVRFGTQRDSARLRIALGIIATATVVALALTRSPYAVTSGILASALYLAYASGNTTHRALPPTTAVV